MHRCFRKDDGPDAAKTEGCCRIKDLGKTPKASEAAAKVALVSDSAPGCPTLGDENTTLSCLPAPHGHCLRALTHGGTQETGKYHPMVGLTQETGKYFHLLQQGPRT